jgi:trehalose 6-phosphate synthase
MNRLVVVSNRVPLPSAGPQAGGLAVALNGMMERRGGLWFGWSGDVADDAGQRDLHRERSSSVDYVTFDLTPEEHEGYYNRFSNGVLWPLLHTLPQMMDYDRRVARVYREVNERIAELLTPVLRPTDLIWVHDYHLLPFAGCLRARHVHNPIGFFLHIPFAPADVLGAAPEMAHFVRDMLSADLIGFQTDNDMKNFAGAAQSLAGAVRVPGNALQVGARRVKLGVFPVEIEAHSFARIAAEMSDTSATARLRGSLTGQSLIIGLDRLDPTKGLLQRVAGLRLLFEKYPEWKRRATALQIAAASRTDVSSYQDLRTALDQSAGALNADLGDPDWTPLRLIARGVPRDVGAGYLRAARVGLVTPLRDGMNLVAKEFVAAQDPENPGALVLSRFAGAARQLEGALLVNPHDADALADALHMALRMGLAERRARWQSMWHAIQDRTPLAWGRGFVSALLRSATVGAFTEAPREDNAAAPLSPFGPAEAVAPERIAMIERSAAERDPTRAPAARSNGTDRRQLN